MLTGSGKWGLTGLKGLLKKRWTGSVDVGLLGFHLDQA